MGAATNCDYIACRPSLQTTCIVSKKKLHMHARAHHGVIALTATHDVQQGILMRCRVYDSNQASSSTFLPT